jgi:hypothetical protein
MELIPTDQDVLHSDAEICLNLWYYVDESGIVLRLAGKAYALAGSEEQKLAALHLLSGSDHLTATPGKVPPQFALDSEEGKMQGVVHADAIFPNHGAVFGPLMDQIERELPKGIRSVFGNYEQFELKIPRDPLCVTTAVWERSDGELVARLGERR